MGQRILICGDRNWIDYDMVLDVLTHLTSVEPELEIIEGEAKGADSAGRVAGEALGLIIHKFPAKWKEFGKKAGYLRNAQMLVEGKPNLVIGFHDDIEDSKGTRMMLDLASKADIPTILYTHSNFKPYGSSSVVRASAL